MKDFDKKGDLYMIEMERQMKILAIQNRIALLRGRTGHENGKIVRKLERRIRMLSL